MPPRSSPIHGDSPGWYETADAARRGSDWQNDPKCRNHDTKCWQPDIDLSCGDGRNQHTARNAGQQEENRMMNVDRPTGSEHVVAWTTKVVFLLSHFRVAGLLAWAPPNCVSWALDDSHDRTMSQALMSNKSFKKVTSHELKDQPLPTQSGHAKLSQLQHHNPTIWWEYATRLTKSQNSHQGVYGV